MDDSLYKPYGSPAGGESQSASHNQHHSEYGCDVDRFAYPDDVLVSDSINELNYLENTNQEFGMNAEDTIPIMLFEASGDYFEGQASLHSPNDEYSSLREVISIGSGYGNIISSNMV